MTQTNGATAQPGNDKSAPDARKVVTYLFKILLFIQQLSPRRHQLDTSRTTRHAHVCFHEKVPLLNTSGSDFSEPNVCTSLHLFCSFTNTQKLHSGHRNTALVCVFVFYCKIWFVGMHLELILNIDNDLHRLQTRQHHLFRLKRLFLH